MDVAAVRWRIAAAAARAGRSPDEVGIVAVTKGHPLERAREAAAAGLADLGENRVQEALSKQAAWPDAPVRWHLIGHLQRNKVRLVVGRFALIHSLDSIRLADALEAAAAAAGVEQDVLVEVNVAREPQKSGVTPEEAPALVAHAAGLPHLRLRGMMTMAPYDAPARVQHEVFGGLRELRDRLSRNSGLATAQPAFHGHVGRFRGRGGGGGDAGAPWDDSVRGACVMSDDVFRLTPLDLRKQEFRKVMRGFDPATVEDFRARAADELERVVRERMALEEQAQADAGAARGVPGARAGDERRRWCRRSSSAPRRASRPSARRR